MRRRLSGASRSQPSGYLGPLPDKRAATPAAPEGQASKRAKKVAPAKEPAPIESAPKESSLLALSLPAHV